MSRQIQEINTLRDQLKDSRIFLVHIGKLLGLPAGSVTEAAVRNVIVRQAAAIKLTREFYTATHIIIGPGQEDCGAEEHAEALYIGDELRVALHHLDEALKKAAEPVQERREW